MITLGKRIQELRKQKGLSQTELALKIGISYPQMSRYEVKDVQPPADVLKRLADALNTNVDYLISGNADEKANASLHDSKLLNLFKSVEKLNEDDKNVVTKLINAFVFQKGIQQQLTL
jgi:transcriptional regulator with XRE-family HTH domain